MCPEVIALTVTYTWLDVSLGRGVRAAMVDALSRQVRRAREESWRQGRPRCTSVGQILHRKSRPFMRD